jgi:hypothetical protein
MDLDFCWDVSIKLEIDGCLLFYFLYAGRVGVSLFETLQISAAIFDCSRTYLDISKNEELFIKFFLASLLTLYCSTGLMNFETVSGFSVLNALLSIEFLLNDYSMDWLKTSSSFSSIPVDSYFCCN